MWKAFPIERLADSMIRLEDRALFGETDSKTRLTVFVGLPTVLALCRLCGMVFSFRCVTALLTC
jgi:hypothetical protein